ncbi:MAG: acyltransferase [Chloroflexi bacterium]|nr:acyltransferase [Chloroflexota bacterium]
MPQRFIRSSPNQLEEVQPSVNREGGPWVTSEGQAEAGSEAATSNALEVIKTYQRKVWLDYLRVFAILAVITGHVIVDFYDQGNVRTAEWWLSNIIGTPARAAVPVFVMVSGALLLGKPYPLAVFYKKRAVRLIPPILFWNLAYLGVYMLYGMDRQTVLWTLKALIVVDGYIAPHLWYLSVFACLMVFAPFINMFILGEKPNGRDLAILLGLSFPFFLLQQIAYFAEDVYQLNMEWFKLFPWLMVYFIAGYVIDNYAAHIRLDNGWIVSAIIALVAVGAGLNYYAVSTLGVMKNYFINSERGPLTFLISILVFLLAKNLSNRLPSNRLILLVAEASFGMYLIHEICNGILVNWLPGYHAHGLVYIPLVAALTTAASFLSIRLLRKIPLMKAVC